MVRLKGPTASRGSALITEISIPYGSIKRASVLTRDKGIVITFQFLMVRLKGLLLLSLMVNTQISIPYGSIKS